MRLAPILFALRSEFPTEWAAFAKGTGDFAFRLRKDLFPYMAQSATLSVDTLELYGVSAGKLARRSPAIPVPVNVNADLVKNGYSDLALPADTSVLKRDAAQVFLVVRYSF